MDDAILSAMPGQKIAFQNVLASITTDFVVVHENFPAATVVISIDSIVELRRFSTTNPGLLVISIGLLTIASAAYVAKQGLPMVIPVALIAMLFVMGYFGGRRASVLFLLENDRFETLKGSFREATSLIRVVERMHHQARMQR
jgi:hypothetical protein